MLGGSFPMPFEHRPVEVLGLRGVAEGGQRMAKLAERGHVGGIGPDGLLQALQAFVLLARPEQRRTERAQRPRLSGPTLRFPAQGGDAGIGDAGLDHRLSESAGAARPACSPRRSRESITPRV